MPWPDEGPQWAPPLEAGRCLLQASNSPSIRELTEHTSARGSISLSARKRAGLSSGSHTKAAQEEKVRRELKKRKTRLEWKERKQKKVECRKNWPDTSQLVTSNLAGKQWGHRLRGWCCEGRAARTHFPRSEGQTGSSFSCDHRVCTVSRMSPPWAGAVWPSASLGGDGAPLPYSVGFW